MKQKSLFYAVIVLLVCNVITLIGWGKSMNRVDKYQYYYKSTEALLDTLEMHYNWVDAVDAENYYEATEVFGK